MPLNRALSVAIYKQMARFPSFLTISRGYRGGFEIRNMKVKRWAQPKADCESAQKNKKHQAA
jgi:hypothetical protein